QRGSEFLAFCLPVLKLDDGFAADSFHFSPAETTFFELLDALKISGNHLKFQAGASGVYDEDIHGQHSAGRMPPQDKRCRPVLAKVGEPLLRIVEPDSPS